MILTTSALVTIKVTRNNKNSTVLCSCDMQKSINICIVIQLAVLIVGIVIMFLAAVLGVSTTLLFTAVNGKPHFKERIINAFSNTKKEKKCL